MDAEHLFRFRSQSCVFKFIRHSVDEASDWGTFSELKYNLSLHIFQNDIQFLEY